MALPPGTREQYVEHLGNLTSANTKVLMTTIEYDQSKVDGPPYSAPIEVIEHLYGPHFAIDQLEHEPYSVPEHLQKKGLTAADHAVYLLQKN